MEKEKTKQNKKKQNKSYGEKFVPDDVPECPKMEDFIPDVHLKCAKQPTSTVEINTSSLDCVDDIKQKEALPAIETTFAQNVESQILDAVEDLPHNYRKERNCSRVENASTEAIELSATDVLVDLPTSSSDTVGTELKELQSYCQQTSFDDSRQDTRLESPAHFVETKQKEKELKEEEKNDVASAPPEVELPARQEARVRAFTEAQLCALCPNPELEAAAELESQFVDCELLGAARLQRHPLYALLVGYLRARQRLTAAHSELDALRKEASERQETLWTVETTTVTESGECQDGNPVTASHEYKVSRLNRTELSTLGRSLATIRDVVHQTMSLECYSSEVVCLQAEHYVHGVETACGASQLPHNAPAILGAESADHWALEDLRASLSVLFTFQRRPIRDSKFVSDCRDWLVRLGAVLVRVAPWRDHLWLLRHVLRCPAGVGQWASSLIQVPPPPPLYRLAATVVTPGGGPAVVDSASVFADPLLRHAVAMLAVLLSPVTSREHFLEQTPLRGDPPSSEPWVLVDSDGEEDEDGRGCGSLLRENDLVALLNQLPFDAIFRHILLVDRRDNRDQYDGSLVTEEHVLRLFAFCTVVVRLLRTGLATYASPRYRQFGRRLGRLIRHIVQYISDLWESFRNGSHWLEPTVGLRLQAEYDAFFLRATCSILSSRGLGVWQFLAVVPYRVASLQALWRLYYLLHLTSPDVEVLDDTVSDWEVRVSEPQVRLQLEEKLTGMADAETYYLLTTFANMAAARGPEDMQFVRTVTLNLLEVGFLSDVTHESCSKTARSLLVGLTAQHSALISDLLAAVAVNFEQASKLSLYLFSELPLLTWQPTEQDLCLLSRWLLEKPPTSCESRLARLVLASLNWGLVAGHLALPLSLHRRVADLVVEACERHDAAPAGGAVMAVTEGVKQVSGLVVRRTSTAERSLSSWAWEMLARLRLHPSELPGGHAVTYTDGPPKPPCHPIAMMAAVLGTGWGHSPPLVTLHGLPALHALSAIHGRYCDVAAALQLILPAILDCADTALLNNERYPSILMSLLTADRTYMKIAKNLINPEFPGPVLRMVAGMLQCQLEDHRRFGRDLIRLWLLSLSRLPDWTRDPAAVHLADTVLRAAFFYPDCRDAAIVILADLHQQASLELDDESAAGLRAGGTLSALISWVSSGAGSWASLIPRCSAPDAAWLAYFALDVERRTLEEQTGLWRQLLTELATSSGKANVDQALKRAAQSLKLVAPSSGNLALYRWAQQALDTPLGHPLLPLLWQKFFQLFLDRVPSTSDVADRGGVGNKFFEGVVNLSMLKKMKRRLQETAEFYRKRSQETTQGDVERINSGCAELMRTFELWLEEPRLHEPSLFLPALPPQYAPDKLRLILSGDTRPWLEYLDYETVRADQQAAVAEWRALRFRNEDRQVERQQQPQTNESTDPAERIVKRLQRYDSPLPPPPLRPPRPVIPPVQREVLMDRTNLLAALKPSFRALVEYAQIYSLRVSEHTALDCSLLELLPALYRDVEMEVLLHAACDVGPDAVGRGRDALVCAGPADIRLKVCEARLSEGTEQLVQQNRAEYDILVSRATQPPPSKVCVGSVYVEHVVSALENDYGLQKGRGDVEAARRMQEVGAALFQHMITLYGEDVAAYPPSKQLFTGCLETLGQVFVSCDESQCCRLLETLLAQPRLAGILGPHFAPTAASTPTFLHTYATVIDCSAPTDLRFVLLSKFDVTRWLMTRKPRLSERSQFIELVGKALTAAGVNPDDDKLILHETFRKHLRLVLLFEFPEHYGEVLSLLLRASEMQRLSPTVWFDLLEVLLQQRQSFGGGANRLGTEHARRFATEQRSLSHRELRETSSLLGSHFSHERLQYGLYGLYPKYRIYVEPLATLLSFIGHGVVVSSVRLERGALSDQLCERHVWPSLRELFSPWLCPYWTRDLREPAAAWIQQLADDRSVLLPWIAADATHARRFTDAFVECVRFLLDTMPGCSNMLSYVWQFYADNFARTAVKEHVLVVVHASLSTLPWDRFWPGLPDLDLMLKVADQFVPECPQFLGAIFLEVSWWSWVGHLLSTFPPALVARAHTCLLHLLIRLAHEPSVRQSTKLLPLLVEARRFAWHLLDASAFESVINWYVASCDPQVVLAPADTDDDDTGRSIDVATLRLLRTAAGHVPEATQVHAQTLCKRQLYVRAVVKLVAGSGKSSQKSALHVRGNAIASLLNEIEAVVTANTPAGHWLSECGFLVSEVLPLAGPGSLGAVARDAICDWLHAHNGHSAVLCSVLKTTAPSLAGCPSALGAVLEAALDAFFLTPESGDSAGDSMRPTWQCAGTLVSPGAVALSPAMVDELTSSGRVLSLYALLPAGEDAAQLSQLVGWVESITPSEATESKLPILWGRCLSLAQRQIEISVTQETAPVVAILQSLANRLILLAEDSSWGSTLLGAIGLRRQPLVSNRFRLLSRAVGTYILAQLPDTDGEWPYVRTQPGAPGAITMTTVSVLEGPVVGPSPAALKALSQLESLAMARPYLDLRSVVEASVAATVDTSNSLHNGQQIVLKLARLLYRKAYLLDEV